MAVNNQRSDEQQFGGLVRKGCREHAPLCADVCLEPSAFDEANRESREAERAWHQDCERNCSSEGHVYYLDVISQV